MSDLHYRKQQSKKSETGTYMSQSYLTKQTGQNQTHNAFGKAIDNIETDNALNKLKQRISQKQEKLNHVEPDVSNLSFF